MGLCLHVCFYLQKLEIQKVMLLKINLPDNQKQKYMEGLTKDFISSKSSGEEELEDSLKDLAFSLLLTERTLESSQTMATQAVGKGRLRSVL